MQHLFSFLLLFTFESLKEWLIIYKGTMELLRGGEKTVLKVGDSILIEPKIKHCAYFPEECKYITITIPPAEEFPNDTR